VETTELDGQREGEGKKSHGLRGNGVLARLIWTNERERGRDGGGPSQSEANIRKENRGEKR